MRWREHETWTEFRMRAARYEEYRDWLDVIVDHPVLSVLTAVTVLTVALRIGGVL